ncbi:MAG: hypothetical protein Q8N98_04930 [bacterium]|nr:hypothetical protein [bacterium]
MNINKLDILLKQPQKLFHTRDLAVLWGVKNQRTLYTTIQRFKKKGVLISIQKGFYSVVPLDQVDPILLGARLAHSYVYLTTESVLSPLGIISQPAQKITFAAGFSKKIKIEEHRFLFRKIQNQYLHSTVGVISREDGVFMASPERAAADLLYFQPRYHFDGENLLSKEKIKEIRKKVGY